MFNHHNITKSACVQCNVQVTCISNSTRSIKINVSGWSRTLVLRLMFNNIKILILYSIKFWWLKTSANCYTQDIGMENLGEFVATNVYGNCGYIMHSYIGCLWWAPHKKFSFCNLWYDQSACIYLITCHIWYLCGF